MPKLYSGFFMEIKNKNNIRYHCQNIFFFFLFKCAVKPENKPSTDLSCL